MHNIIAFVDSFVLNPSMHCDKIKDSVYYKCTHNAVQYQNVLLKIVLFYPVFLCLFCGKLYWNQLWIEPPVLYVLFAWAAVYRDELWHKYTEKVGLMNIN